jgi:HD superfamily phosphodiesterase
MRTSSGTMENKTDNIGKAFFEKKWNDEKIKIHSECVIEACINMSLNTNLNQDIFIIAGWIHDLGIKIDKDKHHISSLDFLKEFLEENKEFSSFKKELDDCILNHRSDGNPETIYGIVFKCADKVALHNNKWLEYKKNKTSYSM